MCYQYWPTRICEPMQFNKLIVTLQSENKKLGYYIRKFEIKEDRVSKSNDNNNNTNYTLPIRKSSNYTFAACVCTMYT